jgi:hypothetical protein
MKVQYPLFSQVALAQDLPEYNLKRGDIATIVEHYPMSEGEEEGYSLEGFDLPHVTIEVPASQIIPVAQWQAIRSVYYSFIHWLPFFLLGSEASKFLL